jgi:hypothetical protein
MEWGGEQALVHADDSLEELVMTETNSAASRGKAVFGLAGRNRTERVMRVLTGLSRAKQSLLLIKRR